MLTDYFALAIKSLKKRGLRSLLTILGVVIGIAAVVSLISLGEGLREAITGQFSSLGTDILMVQSSGSGFGPPGSTAVNKITQRELEIIEQVPGVKEAIPRLIRSVTVDYNEQRVFGTATSIPDNQEYIDLIFKNINIEVAQGRFLRATDTNKIVIGSDYDKERFEKEIMAGSKIKIQGESFEVIGIMEKSSSFIFNDVIFMIEKDLQDLLNAENDIDFIMVQVENEDEIEMVAERIERQLRKERDLEIGEEDFSVQTPLQSISAVNNILTIVNLIFLGIASISLIVGGIGIANTMYTSVLERKREIGVMKSIGAKNSDILLIFIFESGLLGLVGGIIGSLIGLGLAFSASELIGASLGAISLKVQISYTLIFTAVLFSFLVGTLAGILPAMQAAKMNPVEALRK